jgi:hypothetical protein
MPRGCFTGVGERQMAGDGAEAGFTAAARVRRWRGVGLVRVRKKGVRKAQACLYRLGRRRGSGVRAN